MPRAKNAKQNLNRKKAAAAAPKPKKAPAKTTKKVNEKTKKPAAKTVQQTILETLQDEDAPSDADMDKPQGEIMNLICTHGLPQNLQTAGLLPEIGLGDARQILSYNGIHTASALASCKVKYLDGFQKLPCIAKGEVDALIAEAQRRANNGVFIDSSKFGLLLADAYTPESGRLAGTLRARQSPGDIQKYVKSGFSPPEKYFVLLLFVLGFLPVGGLLDLLLTIEKNSANLQDIAAQAFRFGEEGLGARMLTALACRAPEAGGTNHDPAKKKTSFLSQEVAVLGPDGRPTKKVLPTQTCRAWAKVRYDRKECKYQHSLGDELTSQGYKRLPE